uniref:Gamma-interferon-inducible lysosomal thiol reductase n=1 Tax=Nothoprocta perdicaria TaxID=30464 RepID=A0A8C6ZPJ6_NOTPE
MSWRVLTRPAVSRETRPLLVPPIPHATTGTSPWGGRLFPAPRSPGNRGLSPASTRRPEPRAAGPSPSSSAALAPAASAPSRPIPSWLRHLRASCPRGPAGAAAGPAAAPPRRGSPLFPLMFTNATPVFVTAGAPRGGPARAPPVQLSLYYESLCPACRAFVVRQLFATWLMLPDEVLSVTLVPYGNAEETNVNGTWHFECQHGPEECLGNMVEACVIHEADNVSDPLPVIACLESGASISGSLEACLQVYAPRVPASRVAACARGDLGRQLLHRNAQLTAALAPPHQYVPWIVGNRVLGCKKKPPTTPSSIHSFSIAPRVAPELPPTWGASRLLLLLLRARPWL